MDLPGDLSGCVGTWSGTNELHLPWLPDPLRQSFSFLTVSLKANGQCISFEYSWEFEEKPQEGILLLCRKPNSDEIQTVWTDSWHSSNAFLVSDGNVDPDGQISVMGHYKVEGHPEWGWKTNIAAKPEYLRITMYNVSPEGEETLAVDTEFAPT